MRLAIACVGMDDAALTAFPKVVLHDHLDGGLRPGTIVELADEIGYRNLPSTDPGTLASWFARTVKVGGLVGYLSTFDHTIAVMQTQSAIERVAYESAADLAADGVVYAEVRFAPELNTRRGLTMDEVLEAALAGFARGGRDHPIEVGLVVDGMRQERRTREAAQAAARWAAQGVVGFDIAGPEAGFPPAAHLEAFDTARRAGLGITIHAGEAHGPSSIAEAIHQCGAVRIGHGVRIVDDIDGDVLGPLATEIMQRGIVFEMCPRSNVDTGAVESLAEHPVHRLLQLGFAVTVSCDNRLMSATSPVSELRALVDTFGWGRREVRRVMSTAAAAAFLPEARRRALVQRVESFEF